MSEKYSAEWIKEQVGDRTWLPLRECSICNSPLGYVVEDGRVGYNSNCGCVSYTTPLRECGFEGIAESLAIQSSDEIRDRMMSRLLGQSAHA